MKCEFLLKKERSWGVEGMYTAVVPDYKTGTQTFDKYGTIPQISPAHQCQKYIAVYCSSDYCLLHLYIPYLI